MPESWQLAAKRPVQLTTYYVFAGQPSTQSDQSLAPKKKLKKQKIPFFCFLCPLVASPGNRPSGRHSPAVINPPEYFRGDSQTQANYYQFPTVSKLLRFIERLKRAAKVSAEQFFLTRFERKFSEGSFHVE